MCREKQLVFHCSCYYLFSDYEPNWLLLAVAGLAGACLCSSLSSWPQDPPSSWPGAWEEAGLSPCLQGNRGTFFCWRSKGGLFSLLLKDGVERYLLSFLNEYCIFFLATSLLLAWSLALMWVIIFISWHPWITNPWCYFLSLYWLQFRP